MNADIKDELLTGCIGLEGLLGPEGRFTGLRTRLINRILDAELTTHLGYEKHQRPEGPPAERFRRSLGRRRCGQWGGGLL